MAVRYCLRTCEGVFRWIRLDRFQAFVDGRATLGTDPEDGHVKVIEVVVPTKGRRPTGAPSRMVPWRIEVLPNGRVDRERKALLVLLSK